MTEYVRAVKQALRDQHGMAVIGGTEDDPCISCPDGEYLCRINGRVDTVLVVGGRFEFKFDTNQEET